MARVLNIGTLLSYARLHMAFHREKNMAVVGGWSESELISARWKTAVKYSDVFIGDWRRFWNVCGRERELKWQNDPRHRMHPEKRKGEREETDQPQNANIIAVSGPTCLQTHSAVLPGDRQSGHRSDWSTGAGYGVDVSCARANNIDQTLKYRENIHFYRVWPFLSFLNLEALVLWKVQISAWTSDLSFTTAQRVWGNRSKPGSSVHANYFLRVRISWLKQHAYTRV